ncbi:homeobox-leucine zipper protein HAT22-like isoform X1 [Cynara cardunculus var. scolymus]|uniref:homeobox-leucine zipper protein HAT22-like isoform X1 n=1 Tax=Cynara cardunculus var. scolymus TaxID=59895 RepID=UPI000D62915B|nr:homeobox-leucine zipper protein HAT22-like isoform X1 [Cynara cardunculus var. scolymus]
MGFHSFAANTQLVLELGLNSSSSASIPQNPSKISNPTTHHHHHPSLTLALSGDSCGGSSFSNASVKREREVASEESERVNTSGTDQEDEDGSVSGRKKLRLTKAQSGLLEEAFKLHTNLNPQKQKQELAKDLKLKPRQVEVWFQNRRARTKLKQTEVECDYLKKCCDTLKDENRRLRQEVEELKAEKVSTTSQTVYMQLPAATLSMCPSYEHMPNPKTPFTMPPKPHFLNPFTTSSSAAC